MKTQLQAVTSASQIKMSCLYMSCFIYNFLVCLSLRQGGIFASKCARSFVVASYVDILTLVGSMWI